MKVEVAVVDSPSLIFLYGLCGRKATLNLNMSFRSWCFTSTEAVWFIRDGVVGVAWLDGRMG